MKYQYFKTKKDRQDYLGNRYFRVCFTSDTVLQILFSTGETKKGKGNNMGIFLIASITFYTNYLGMNYAVPCTKKEFENKRELILKMLK